MFGGGLSRQELRGLTRLLLAFLRREMVARSLIATNNHRRVGKKRLVGVQ